MTISELVVESTMMHKVQSFTFVKFAFDIETVLI